MKLRYGVGLRKTLSHESPHLSLSQVEAAKGTSVSTDKVRFLRATEYFFDGVQMTEVLMPFRKLHAYIHSVWNATQPINERIDHFFGPLDPEVVS